MQPIQISYAAIVGFSLTNTIRWHFWEIYCSVSVRIGAVAVSECLVIGTQCLSYLEMPPAPIADVNLIGSSNTLRTNTQNIPHSNSRGID